MSYLSPSEQLNVWKQQRQAEQDRKFAPMWEMAERAHQAKVQQNADIKTANLIDEQRRGLGLKSFTPEQIDKIGYPNLYKQTQIDNKARQDELLYKEYGIDTTGKTPKQLQDEAVQHKIDVEEKKRIYDSPQKKAEREVDTEYFKLTGGQGAGMTYEQKVMTIEAKKKALKADTETYKEISKYGIDVKNVSDPKALNNFLKAQPDIKNAKKVLQKNPIQLKQEYEAKTKELAGYGKRPPGERGKIYDKLEKDIKTLQQEMKFLDGVQQFLSKDEVVTGQTQQTAQSQKQVKYKPIVQGAIDYINNPNDQNYDPVKAKDAMTKLVNQGIDTSVFTVDISELGNPKVEQANLPVDEKDTTIGENVTSEKQKTIDSVKKELEKKLKNTKIRKLENAPDYKMIHKRKKIQKEIKKLGKYETEINKLEKVLKSVDEGNAKIVGTTTFSSGEKVDIYKIGIFGTKTKEQIIDMIESLHNKINKMIKE